MSIYIDLTLTIEIALGALILGFGLGLKIANPLLFKIKTAIHAMIWEYIVDFRNKVEANPKEFEEMIQPFMKVLVSKGIATAKGEIQEGFKAPSWLSKFLGRDLASVVARLGVNVGLNLAKKHFPEIGEQAVEATYTEV